MCCFFTCAFTLPNTEDRQVTQILISGFCLFVFKLNRAGITANNLFCLDKQVEQLTLLACIPQAHLVPAPWHEISRPTQEGTEGWSRALHHTLILRPGENRKKCSAQHLGVAGAARPWAQTEWVNTNDWANGRWGAHAFARPVKKKKKMYEL